MSLTIGECRKEFERILPGLTRLYRLRKNLGIEWDGAKGIEWDGENQDDERLANMICKLLEEADNLNKGVNELIFGYIAKQGILKKICGIYWIEDKRLVCGDVIEVYSYDDFESEWTWVKIRIGPDIRYNVVLCDRRPIEGMWARFRDAPNIY